MGTKIKHEKIRRKQTTGEEIANAITHGIMVLFAIAIMVVLLTRSHYQAIKIFSAIVFGVSMIVLYINSCLYHSLTNNTAKNKVFRRLDHVSIYLLIGGTYAPILLTLDTLQTPLFAGSLSIGISTFIAQWVLIAVGITCKCVFFKKYHWIHVITFLLLGCLCFIFVDKLWAAGPLFFWLIVGGGLAYVIGIVFYIIKKVKYFHFVWHIFTMIGTVLHALAIVLVIYQ